MFYKETEYALRGLIYIQMQNDRMRRPGKTEIASQIGAPEAYIAKILQNLVKKGMIESQKGKNGGFYFDPGKPELKLIDVIHFTEGSHLFNGCGLGLEVCSKSNPCPLHDRYVAIRESIHSLLSRETIQNLARKINPNDQPVTGSIL